MKIDIKLSFCNISMPTLWEWGGHLELLNVYLSRHLSIRNILSLWQRCKSESIMSYRDTFLVKSSCNQNVSKLIFSQKKLHIHNMQTVFIKFLSTHAMTLLKVCMKINLKKKSTTKQKRYLKLHVYTDD